MKSCEFSLIVEREGSLTKESGDFADWMDEVAESLAKRMGGLPDVSVMGHRLGLELAFHRESESLDSALTTAIAAARSAGLKIIRVELNEEAIESTLTVA